MRTRPGRCTRTMVLLAVSSLFLNLNACAPKDPLYKIATQTGLSLFDALTGLVIATATEALFPGQTDTTGEETTDGSTAG